MVLKDAACTVLGDMISAIERQPRDLEPRGQAGPGISVPCFKVRLDVLHDRLGPVIDAVAAARYNMLKAPGVPGVAQAWGGEGMFSGVVHASYS